MQELLDKRSYTRKVFSLEGNKKLYRFHTAHKHFKNEKEEFETIDTTLSFDETTKQFCQSKASYHCNIPEYADDWFEFYNAYEGANHTIKAKPVASHVKGVAFSADDGQGVLYKDAFGKGIDLKVYAYWHGLKKVIIINEKPAEIADMSFDFEMELPSTKVKDRQGIEWDKSSTLDFKDKTLKIGEEGKESYFHNAMMWDSGKNRENVNIELYTKDGKTYLRKTIPKEFLEKATYPVYTDHPTNYNPTAGDGDVNSAYSEIWDTAHDATSGSDVDYSASNMNCLVYGGTFFFIQRMFIPINTSGIVDDATIISASLYLYLNVKDNLDNDGDDWMNIVKTSQISTTTLTYDDYAQCGEVDNPIEGATRINIGNLNISTYNAWTLNSTGIGWIDKTGITKLGMREGHDCIDSAVTNLNDMGCATSENTSGTKDPYLDVTTSGGTNYNSTFTETITCSETTLRSGARILSETITPTEAIMKSSTRLLSENITTSETIKKSPAKSFLETSTLAETYSRRLTLSRLFSETSNLTESIVKGASKIMSDIATLTESITKIKAINLILSETINLTETIQRGISRFISETITTTESIFKASQRIFSETVNFTETICKAITRSIDETITLADDFLKQSGVALIFTETITLTENFVKQLSFSRIFSETVNLVESFSNTRVYQRLFVDEFYLSEIFRVPFHWSHITKNVGSWANSIKNSTTWNKITGANNLWSRITKISPTWNKKNKNNTTWYN